MQRHLLYWVIAALSVGCATTLYPTARPKAATAGQAVSSLALPKFHLHTYSNGLRLLSVEKHDHPIVGLTAYVTTGGRTESPPYAGALHYIEHLVFKGGTKRFKPTEFRQIIASLGDENGGWTWDDEIQFGFEVPVQNFNKALDVFAESLLELQWNEPWFEAERKVVLQEIEKVSEQPWHRLWNAWDNLMFTRHPYGRAVIGDAETVRAQTMEQLHTYYLERFTPNHLMLIVVGDFDRKQLIAEVGRRFGRYKAGPESFELPNVKEPIQRQARHMRIQDSAVKKTRFLAGFRTPGASHPDTAALLLLAHLLSSRSYGLPAMLQKGRQWLTSLQTNHTYMVDYGHLVIEGEMAPGNETTVLKWLRQFMTQIDEESFSQEAVSEAARNLLVKRARSWESYGKQAQELGFMVERMGKVAAQKLTRRILQQSPQSLARVARRYFKPERWVEAVLSPLAIVPDVNGIVEDRQQKANAPSLAAPGLLLAAPGRQWQWRATGKDANVHRFDFDSGLTLLVRRTSQSPLVAAVAHVRGGQWVESPDQAGISVLTSRLLATGSQRLTGSEWDRYLSEHALSYSSKHSGASRANVQRNVYARDGANIYLGGTRAQWKMILALMSEALFRPIFPDIDVTNQRAAQLSEVETLFHTNLEYIKQEFYPLAFPNHPYGRPTIGTKDTVSKLTRADIVSFHARNYRPDRVVIAISADVAPRSVAEFIATRWSDVNAAPSPRLNESELKTRPKAKRSKVLDLGRKQRCINYGAPTLSIRDQRFPVARVLFGVVRALHFYKYVYKRGVSYRSWINVWPQRGPSAWIMENDVATKGFDQTLLEMEQDLRQYAQGRFTTEQVIKTRKQLSNRAILDAQSARGMAFDLALNEGLGAGFERVTQRLKLLAQVTREDVNRLARQIFGSDELYRLQLR
jgi:zinc protease